MYKLAMYPDIIEWEKNERIVERLPLLYASGSPGGDLLFVTNVGSSQRKSHTNFIDMG